ncbi:MAG: prepilin-type N-terminal cleavage/methylation domain-containing protein [Planctomycetes bacterium]|nr:prepilin-type N-terminal cleavage/methylation domain-containing protein [Planctomycetota bacterium]
MSSRNDRRGFTLVEVLVASFIFAMLASLALMIITMVTGSWERLRSRTEAYRHLDIACNALVDDLRAVNGDSLGSIQDVAFTRFLAYVDSDGNHVLAFTRAFGLGRERANYITAEQGEDYFDYLGINGRPAGSLLPPDGVAEVVYFARDGNLYRAQRAPATGSFQDLLNPARAQAVSAGILRFSVRFWGPDTEWWEKPVGEVDKRTLLKKMPLVVWDSTRGIGNQFNGFPYEAGPDSAADPGDDVFPHMAEVALVLDGGKARAAVLRKGLGLTDGVLYTSSTSGIPGPDVYPYLYLDGEWVKYAIKEKNSFIVERGALSSTAAPHPAGTRVRWGYPAAFRVYIPAGKDAYDTGESARGGAR